MKRLLVFLLRGPVFGVLVVIYLVGEGYGPYSVPIAFFFTLIVCAIIGPVDGVLAHVAPVWLRVPMTTIVGAAATAGVALGLELYASSHLGKSMVPLPMYQMIPIAVFGALWTGVCSLISHDYNAQKARPGDISGSRS